MKCISITTETSILGNIFYRLTWFPYIDSNIKLFKSALTIEELIEYYNKNINI